MLLLPDNPYTLSNCKCIQFPLEIIKIFLILVTTQKLVSVFTIQTSTLNIYSGDDLYELQPYCHLLYVTAIFHPEILVLVSVKMYKFVEYHFRAIYYIYQNGIME